MDIQGKHLNRPVSDLLGGAVRTLIAFGGYLFFKFAKPADQPGMDMFGKVMTPDAMVVEAQEMVTQHGFKSLKLKGGVLEPEQEVETLIKLREAFPNHPLRIDPMGAWTVETPIKLARRLAGVLQYLEYPAKGMDGMAAVAPFSPLPLATNLVVVEFPQIFEAMKKGAVQIILSDHHYWQGMHGAIHLGRICAAARLAFRPARVGRGTGPQGLGRPACSLQLGRGQRPRRHQRDSQIHPRFCAPGPEMVAGFSPEPP